MTRARTVRSIAIGLVLVSLLVVAGRAGLAYREMYRTGFAFDRSVARTAESIRRHEKAFLDDQAYVAGLPLFARRTGTRDAGPVIGPRIHWVRVKPGLVEYPASSRRTIDPGLYDEIGDDWPKAAPELWRGLDFAWMAQLAQLDFWDLERNSMSEPSDLMGPDPHFSDLLTWAKLRLAKGLREHALPAAAAEVEDLARLCFTTERLSTGLDGIALLSLVRTAQKQAGGSPPATDLGRIQRAFFGAIAFARLETPPEYAATFDLLRIGRCSALHDGAWSALLTRAALHESRPEEYRRLEALLARSPECRLRRIRDSWASPDDPSLEGNKLWERTLWRWSPTWRRTQGEILVAIGAQDWFRGYDRSAAR